ncbi:glycosyltransferase family 4 protein [Sphingomonas sp. LR55]|uniref:glycosyltransferase family 4 protein n=1 Tax=Sphingomonas sp. LR55 TaxID=3050231 RepID=UPI002FE09BC0
MRRNWQHRLRTTGSVRSLKPISICSRRCARERSADADRLCDQLGRRRRGRVAGARGARDIARWGGRGGGVRACRTRPPRRDGDARRRVRRASARRRRDRSRRGASLARCDAPRLGADASLDVADPRNPARADDRPALRLAGRQLAARRVPQARQPRPATRDAAPVATVGGRLHRGNPADRGTASRSPARLVQWSIFRADPNAKQATPWREEQPVRIGSLGRLHPVKGYDVLIEALALIETRTPYEIVIAGDGAERAALEARAQALGLTTLRFAGYAADPAAFLADCHVYVQPSRSEGLCVAAHEAMQAGLPVVASAVGELPGTIVEGETGFTVPPGDPVALARALSSVLARPAQLAAMGQAGRTRVLATFGPERFAATGLAILERMRAFGLRDRVS